MLENSAYLKIHIITVYLSYAAFFTASASAVLFLVQDNALKNKRSGIIFSRLPGLSLLDKLNYRSIGLGFPILTISIFYGLLWSRNVHGIYWLSNQICHANLVPTTSHILLGYNSRIVSSIVLWLIYAVILHMRLSVGMRGRKVSVLSILAFFVIVFSLFGACH